jgi:hypothetical protein
VEIAKEQRFRTFPPHDYGVILTFLLCNLSDALALH